MRFLTVLCLLTAHTLCSAADPWPQYGGPTGDFRLPEPKPSQSAPAWKRPIGPGTSGIVADGTLLYTLYVVPKDGGKSGNEFAIAIDPATGKTVWEESDPVKLLPKQESFGGSPMQPQATPAVFEGRVFTVGFTGILSARDTATGKRIWSVDLVADLGATPVQFGFSASPILHDGRLIVAVGGRHATVAFDPATGKVLWASEAAEPGYATPVVMKWNDQPLIVQLARDDLFGFAAATGKTAWKYALPTPKITNVPTPIVLPGGRILVSGQGLEGTRLLRLVRTGDSTEPKEVWHQRKAQFFYSNWVCDGEAVYGFPGNAGKRLTALKLADGSVRSQDAGQTDANLLLLGDRLLVLRGDGLLSLGSPTAQGFKVSSGGKPVSGRCWVAPTLVGDRLIVRSDSELASVPLSSLVEGFKAPADSGVSALDAAFGSPKPKAPKE